MTLAERYLVERGADLAVMQGRDHLHDFRVERMMQEHELRDAFIARFGFAVLTDEAITRLKSYGPFIEIGAGSGYWAYELGQAGVDVIATDPGTGRYGPVSGGWTAPWTSVHALSAQYAVRAYPARNLLTVWPDYNQTWAAEALVAFAGSHVAYVGESSGGCTGDSRLHELLETAWEEIAFVPLPQFWGLHDNLWIYRRREDAA